MNQKLRLGLRSALCLCVLSVLSCDTKELDVIAEVRPESPVAINADYKFISPITFEEVTITKPWFSFRVRVKNNSERKITITAITLKIEGLKAGSVTNAEVGFTGEGVDATTPLFDTNCDGSVVTGNPATNPNADIVGVIFQITRGVGCQSNVLFYAGSLPEDDDFQYTVTATFVGWYNKSETEGGRTYDVPAERLEITQQFSTQ